MNKAILMGRLVKEPEVRYTEKSSEPLAIARYTLAVNRRFKKDGESDADFINCVAFGKPAEFAEKYFKKGMKVLVTGRIQVRSWDDQSGQKRWSTEVVIEEQDFVESKAASESYASSGSHSSSESYAPSGNYAPSQASAAPKKSYDTEGFSTISDTIDDEDLPF